MLISLWFVWALLGSGGAQNLLAGGLHQAGYVLCIVLYDSINLYKSFFVSQFTLHSLINRRLVFHCLAERGSNPFI